MGERAVGSPTHQRNVKKSIVPSLLVFAYFSLIILLSISVVSEDSDAGTCDNITVYVGDLNNNYKQITVSGVSSVEAAIESALNKLGMAYEYGNEGKFKSVDGVEPDQDHYWRIHQWLPLGTPGWGLMSYDSRSDSYMKSGCSYCLHVSSLSSVDGSNVYSVPDFEPESTGYVFIRFANGYDADNPMVQDTFTSEVREKGFWLSGRGSNMAQVLENAVTAEGLQIELSSYTDTNENALRGWIISMFGLGDDSRGGGTWAYWSQWMWVDHAWTYNNWTMGYYDPAVYKYMECIYLISAVDPYGGGYSIDKGGDEPNPDTDSIVCIKNNNKVTFKANGKTVATQTVKYGQTVDLSKVKDPVAPEGKTFAGWGDVMSPIVRDTTFTAKFEDGGDLCTVRYYDETKSVLLYTEKVASGSAATYSGTPSKAEDSEYTYKFKGWSSDLSNVTSDMDVTPVYEKVKKSSSGDDPSPTPTPTPTPTPHVHEWSECVVTKEATCKGTGTMTYTCSCGQTKTETIPATGHSWSEWEVTKQATDSEKGMKQRTCEACGEAQTLEIEIQKAEIRVEDDASETVSVIDGEVRKTESKVKSGTVEEDGKAVTTLDPSAMEQAVKQILSVDDCTKKTEVTIRIAGEALDAKSSELRLSAEDLTTIAEAGGCTISYSTDACVIDVDAGVLSSLGRNSMSLSFGDDTSSSVEKFGSISQGRGIEISLKSEGNSIHELGGKMSVSVPYEVPESMDAKSLRVWYVNGDSLEAVDCSYDPQSGTVSFDTDHCSTWIIGFGPEGGSDNGSGSGSSTAIAIAAIAVVIIAIVAIMAVKKRK